MTGGPGRDSDPAGPVLGPGFTRFWIAEAVSSFGTYVTLLALQTLVVLTLDGTAREIGWLNAVRWLPYLLLGLMVGALVERGRRRPVLVVTDLLRASLLASLPLAWAADVLTFPLLLGVVGCYGVASLVNDAASMSLLPRLVPRGGLQRAHARVDGADAVAQTAGPSAAGLLVTLVGAPLAVLVDAATYLFSAVVMAMLPVHEVARGREPGGVGRKDGIRLSTLRREIGEGVRWVYRGSGLATLAVATHVWFAANAVLGVVAAPFALLTLGLSPFEFGLVTAATGVGGVIGAGFSTAAGRRWGTGGAVIAAHGLTTTAVGVMATAGLGMRGWVTVAVLGVGQLGHGVAMGLSNSHEMSYRQALTPDALQARTNTTMRSFNRAVIVVVAPPAGMLAGGIGVRMTLAVAVALFGTAVAVLALSPFRTARVEDLPASGG